MAVEIGDDVVKCDECGTLRNESHINYDPMQLVFGQEVGWYDGGDASLCPECLAALFRRANRG